MRIVLKKIDSENKFYEKEDEGEQKLYKNFMGPDEVFKNQ